jgi:hypothetical protein
MPKRIKALSARPRLRFHRHASCDRQDIPCESVGIGIGRERPPVSPEQGKLQFSARNPGGCTLTCRRPPSRKALALRRPTASSD